MSCGMYESLIYENRSLVPLLDVDRHGGAASSRRATATTGRTGATGCAKGCRGCSPARFCSRLRVGSGASHGDVTRNIGLSLGADICWPLCFEQIIEAARPRDPRGRATPSRFEVERVTIEPFDLRQPCKYDVVARPADALVSHEPRVDQKGRS